MKRYHQGLHQFKKGKNYFQLEGSENGFLEMWYLRVSESAEAQTKGVKTAIGRQFQEEKIQLISVSGSANYNYILARQKIPAL